MQKLDVPPSSTPRERILSDAEVIPVLKAALSSDDTFHHIVALLILTGQRKGEIAHLQWDWIDEAEQLITLPSAITKNKRTHAFPYGEMVSDVLSRIPRFAESPYVFPAMREQVRGKPATVYRGFGNSKERFDKTIAQSGAKLEHWTLHDLRRTFSSGMAALSVSQTTVEKHLNHVSGGTLSPIARVYNRYSYLAEMRAAVRLWETKLETLLST
jgi:integrase